MGPSELLLVPAGQVHSYAPHDVNTGYLCHFHPEVLRRHATPEPEFLKGWGYPLLHFEPEAAVLVHLLLGRMLSLYQAQAALPGLLPHLATLLAEATHA